MKEDAPIRVCHLASDDVWGGAEAAVASLLRAQAAMPELDVQLLTLNEGRLSRLARESGVPWKLIPETGRGVFALKRDLEGHLRQARLDIVHSHRYKENLLSYLTARAAGARSVVTLHGDEPPESLRLRVKVEIRRVAIHLLARAAGARFASVSDDLRRRLGLSRARCVVIPNAVHVPVRPEAPGTWREEGRAPVIGWVGRLVPIKGLPVLLEALAELRGELASTRLLLVGDGPDRMGLEALAARLGVADRAEFAGYVDEPAPLRARMDVFALPSLHEGVPLALLEAMAAGVACVASDVGGIPEVDGGSGAIVLVPRRDAITWSGALASVLSDPLRAAELGKRGRARVSEHYSVDAIVHAYLGLYRSVLRLRGLSRARSTAPA